MSNKKAIVLLSGGLDSAVTLYFALSKGYHCHCLNFDYHQRHKREIKSAQEIALRVGCALTLEKISLPRRGSSLLDKHMAVPGIKRKSFGSSANIPSTYVPGRNIIFLSFALSFAEIEGAGSIFIGAHAEDYSGYPDCRPQFYRDFRKVAVSGTKAGVEGRPIKILTPLLHKSKAQIIELGKRLGVPFELTWSCYKGGKVPCGKCDSCYYRAKGFKSINLADPGQ